MRLPFSLLEVLLNGIEIAGLMTLAVLLDALFIYAAKSFEVGKTLNDWRLTIQLLGGAELIIAGIATMTHHPSPSRTWRSVRRCSLRLDSDLERVRRHEAARINGAGDSQPPNPQP